MGSTPRAGRYRLEGVVGVGSFATVHRAVDDRLDDTVVVKVLAENHSLNPEIRERFIAEGRSLRRVRSPHVVTVHDIGENDRQQPYLVLEHADRGTLAARVAELRAQGWTASAADLLAVARGLAAAVEAVHDARLVHRDLSPGNVLLRTGPSEAPGDAGPAGASAVVRPDERLMVADLGMCKDLALSSGLTVAGGTDGFRPPEQDRSGVVDTRADLWAMSALLQWLGEGAALPGGLTAALRRSLADAPARRHADVAHWLADVEAALVPPPPEPRPGPVPGPAPRRAGRAAAAVSLALVVGLAAGLLGGVLGERALHPAPPSTAGSARVAVDGPDAAQVGEPATFRADVAGAEHWVWELPTGAYVVDERVVTLTARSAGDADVVLRAQAPDGTDLEAVHHVAVTDP